MLMGHATVPSTGLEPSVKLTLMSVVKGPIIAPKRMKGVKMNQAGLPACVSLVTRETMILKSALKVLQFCHFIC